MKTSRSALAATLAEKSLRNADRRAFAKEIAAYLLEASQTGELDSLMRDIMKYRAEHGIVEVVAISAHELTSDIKQEITKLVKDHYPAATNVIISEEHDTSVVGGVRLEFADQQLDLSVRNKLNLLKRLTVSGKE